MSIHIKRGGVVNNIPALSIKLGGSQRVVQEVWIKRNGAVQKVFTNFTATVDIPNPSSEGQGFTLCGDPGTTPQVTVTPIGGAAPYSYAWARVGAAAQFGPYEAVAPNLAVTGFKDQDDNVCDFALNPSETWRCTVTDDNGDTATVDVTVTLTWRDLS